MNQELTNPQAPHAKLTPKRNENSVSVDYDTWIDEPLTDEELARLNALSLKDAVDW